MVTVVEVKSPPANKVVFLARAEVVMAWGEARVKLKSIIDFKSVPF